MHQVLDQVWTECFRVLKCGCFLCVNIGDATRSIPACAACHGPTGRGNPAAGYPALHAQESVYVIKQLSAYSADVRYAKNEKGVSYGGDNGNIMHTIAARLNDEDMRNLASYVQGMR